jgi:carboxymethylenebutenolidase
MGGREAFFAPQEFPDRFRASASLHGSRLVPAADDSPHRLVHCMRGEVYCGFAQFDRGAPPEVVGKIEQSLQAVAGLNCARARLHDHAAAESDWREIFAMLRRQLGH